jgi:peptidyl-prolyl cis-trans isomerase C
MKLLREPLLHFMLIGAFIYLLYAAFAEPVVEEPDKTIVVTAGEIEWMQTSWQKRWNRSPTTEELDGLIKQYIKETVLYREALNMGLDKHDQVIRRRLAQKMEFLTRDLVNLTPPTEEDLQAYFKENQEFYQEPSRFTFTQVFIDPSKHGEATLKDAEKIKAALIARGEDIDDVSGVGDGIMLQNYYPEIDRAEIQKLFGNDFSESLVELTPGQWHGPVPSGYGLHLVYVHSVVEPPAVVLDDVRKRVTLDWETEKGIELNEQFYNSLRQQYTIVIQEAAADKVATMQEAKP